MKKRSILAIAACLIGMTMLFAGCTEVAPKTSSTQGAASGGAQSQEEELEGKLTLNGSTSMAQVCQALGEAFENKNEGVKVEKSGAGSGDAPKAVLSGTALIGDLSRELKDSETPEEFTAVTIALDGIAVIVNSKNPVSALTKDQIAQIYSGEVTNWKELGGSDAAITVVGREENSGTRDGFESIIKAEKYAYGITLPETGDVVAKVGNDQNAIGYVSLASVKGETIKALQVDGVDATEENVANGTYVLQRPFVQIYKKGSDSELIKAWFAFVESEEGQKIIADQGLVATAHS